MRMASPRAQGVFGFGPIAGKRYARLGREIAATVAAWFLIAGVASVLRVVASTVSGRASTLATATMDFGIIALWAAATPVVLRSARWLPVRDARAVRNAAAHLVIGTTFVVIANVLIRLPSLHDRGWTALASSTALGLAMYYPAA